MFYFWKTKIKKNPKPSKIHTQLTKNIEQTKNVEAKALPTELVPSTYRIGTKLPQPIKQPEIIIKLPKTEKIHNERI